MSLWKRGRQYWSDFTVNGRRYRKWLGTTYLRVATRRERSAPGFAPPRLGFEMSTCVSRIGGNEMEVELTADTTSKAAVTQAARRRTRRPALSGR